MQNYHQAKLPPIKTNQNLPTNRVDSLKNPRSIFDLSQSITTTIQCDLVYPLFWEEVIPSDTFEIKTALGGYPATPLFPLLDNVYIQYDWWFIPHRLVWPHWKNMLGEREISGSTNPQTNYIVPIIDDTSKEYAAAAGTIAAQGFKFDGLFGYLLAGNQVGVPMVTSKGNYITSLLARSYMLTGYSWYWDQNYGTIFVNAAGANEASGFIAGLTGDGPDDASKFQLFKKGKKLNYYTAGAPNIMQGNDGSVYLTNALGAFIPIESSSGTLPSAITRVPNALGWKVYNSGANTTDNNDPGLKTNAAGTLLNNAGTSDLSMDPNGGLTYDVSTLGLSINNIRLYEQIQKYYERSTRAGQRYVEYLYATYGVTPEDSRLQLPEWLGGHTELLQYTPVANTSNTDTGTLAAFGTLQSFAPTITKSFPEHGYVMCLATVFPDQTFQYGIDRKLRRRTKYQIHDPLFENLTEQAMEARELYVTDNAAQDGAASSYVPRYSEMKSGKRKLSGMMRSNHPNTLDAWHLAQEFTSGVTNNVTFRTYNTDFARTQAVTSDPVLILYGQANITAARPMQVNPTPMIGGY